MTEPSFNEPVSPHLEFLTRCEVRLAPVRDHGDTPWGRRRVIDITGGRFTGPYLAGEVLPGGADWQIVRTDGSTAIDTRYSLRTTDEALLHLRTQGFRHGDPAVLEALVRGEAVKPSDYYFRITAWFETAAPAYAWLNNLVIIGSGVRTADAVIYDAYVVR